MEKNISVKNVAVKDLMLLLAKSLQKDCPYVDVLFFLEKRTLGLRPITQEDHDRELYDSREKLDEQLDDSIINEGL